MPESVFFLSVKDKTSWFYPVPAIKLTRWLLASLFCLSYLLAASAYSAVDTVAYDNVHIAVTDTEAAKQWYVQYLGGVEHDDGLVYFGDTYIRFVPAETIQPSAGSVIDHIGLSFSNLEATLANLEGSGATLTSPMREVDGLFKLAFIEDPWGIKFELVEDPQWPGFHHIHLRVDDPTTTLDWYEDKVGGNRERLKGRLDGLRYGGVWLLASRRNDGESLISSAQSAIRNVAWEVRDVVPAAEQFKQQNVTLISDVRPFENLRYAFFEDPNGVRVELLHYEEP